MISIEKCNEVLNKNEQKYCNEKVKAIRDYLYQMAMVVDQLKPKENE